MKITKEYLRRVIKEELDKAINEGIPQLVSARQIIAVAEKVGDTNLANMLDDRIRKSGKNNIAFTTDMGPEGLKLYFQEGGQLFSVIRNPEVYNSL